LFYEITDIVSQKMDAYGYHEESLLKW